MRLIKFLSLLEKIIIVLIILCFVPIALFAYLPNDIKIPIEMQNAYQKILTQANLNGFLTSMIKNQQCSVERLALMNQKCMQRCKIGIDCFILGPSQPCKLKYTYRINQTQICSDALVQNNRSIADTIQFNFSSSLLPISSITINKTSQVLKYQYYCMKDIGLCRSLVNFFATNIQESFTDNYQVFLSIVEYLMLFGLLPLVIHTIVVLILDSCCKFNLRLTNSLMIINQSLAGAGIIIAGIAFNSRNDELYSKIKSFASQCLIQTNQCQQISLPFAEFNENDGISSGFVTLMCFILALEILLLIGVVAINILMVKYYKLREIDPELSGYQLQTL